MKRQNKNIGLIVGLLVLLWLLFQRKKEEPGFTFATEVQNDNAEKSKPFVGGGGKFGGAGASGSWNEKVKKAKPVSVAPPVVRAKAEAFFGKPKPSSVFSGLKNQIIEVSENVGSPGRLLERVNVRQMQPADVEKKELTIAMGGLDRPDYLA